MNVPAPLASARGIRIASYVLAGSALVLVLLLHLLPALFAGLLVYELVHAMTPLLGRRISGERARLVVVTVLGVVVVGLLTLLVIVLIGFFRNEVGNPGMLWQQQLMPLVERARQQLPAALTSWLPDSVDELRVMALDLTRKHAMGLQNAGKETARVLVRIIVGLVLGALVALNRERPSHQIGPLAAALGERCQHLAEAFHHIVFAQIKISLINTAATGVFLLGVLPVMDVHVPLAKTLVVVTFLAGLLPVIGNLISNTAVTIAGLSVSMWVAAVSLAFLIVIHKLEYFLNARIVGTQIRARAWELLVAMLAMEAAFGVAGLIAAPIYYAYLKSELETEGMV
ncbi:AI-2E family transporter [Dyella jejuensis]|uniref:AI-2E family transporter n=1 Tax=Dyella jejuensis TaxID=1432009 RepID=A0ABW8JJ69_9GAMM